jgi:acyl dehydratase
MSTQRYFEDIQTGASITGLSKGPMTAMHIMRWSAAIENWHRIHYDRDFATGHDGLPDILVNGSWKQHVMVQMLKDWAGRDRLRRMRDPPGKPERGALDHGRGGRCPADARRRAGAVSLCRSRIDPLSA